MSTDVRAVLDELRQVLGAQSVVCDRESLLTYECDALTTHRELPGALLLPRTTDEVSRAAKILSRAGIAYVPRGAGTGLSGGAVALNGAVVLSLTKMDQILEIDVANARARVQPGVVNARLGAALVPVGLYYAPDPSSQSVCTLGGNVAENAGGLHCLKYGTTVNHVAALTVVLPDGEVVRLGGTGEQLGFDLVGLFIGSEGTFGIATEIEVKLLRIPESVVTLLAIFDEVEGAGGTVSAFIDEGLMPAALEMMDGEAIKAVEASSFAVGYPPNVGAALIIEFDGAREGLARCAERARAVCLKQGAREVRVAKDDAERERLWQARKKAYAVVARLAPDLLVQDMVVPRGLLPQALRQIYEIAGAHRLKIVASAHLGDGNIHPSFLFDRRDADQVKRVERASEEMLKICVAMGGSITGEHGVGLDKRENLGLMFREAELSAMWAVRRVFNPHDWLNPNKVLPLRSCREWSGSRSDRANG